MKIILASLLTLACVQAAHNFKKELIAQTDMMQNEMINFLTHHKVSPQDLQSFKQDMSFLVQDTVAEFKSNHVIGITQLPVCKDGKTVEGMEKCVEDYEKWWKENKDDIPAS